MYFKRWTPAPYHQKSIEPPWVQWTHHSEGKTHCPECLALDGCFFHQGKAPTWPHHPYCHCTLEEVPYAVVWANASAYSDYSKFDPYLFDPENFYKHGKNRAFESWGYSISDSLWLKAEMEKQALEKYVSGEYALGKLDKYGQHISIHIEIPRKDRSGTVSFLSGWMVKPNGKLKLNTPYGGK